MARGPAPAPDAVKRARGNPGKRQLSAVPTPAPSPAAAGGAVPHTGLTAGALAIWNLLAPELSRLNVLRGTDGGALSRYCDDVAAYWNVCQRLKKLGLTYKVTSNHGSYTRLNPLFLVQERLAARLIAMEDRFGLSPQSRQALMVRAAQVAASQGALPFGGAAQPDATPDTDASPIGIFAQPTTQH